MGLFQTAFRSEKPGRSGVQEAVIDQRGRTCPVLMSAGLALCARCYCYCGRFSSNCLGAWGQGKKVKKKSLCCQVPGRGQDYLSLFEVAHHSIVNGLAVSRLSPPPPPQGFWSYIRNFCYPGAFHSQPKCRRIHKRVTYSFSIGMVP